jgi:PAS domain S-box-containing protein
MAIVTAAYALAVWTGLRLMVQPEQFAIFWPAAGLAIAALLRLAPAQWPVLLGFFFLTHLVAERLVGFDWGPAVLLPAIALAEVAVAAAIVRRTAYQDGEFTRWTILVLTTAMSVVAAFSSATASLVVHRVADAAFARAWLLWWSSEVLGALLVAPPILLAPSLIRWWRYASPARRAEMVATLAVIAVAAVFIFTMPVRRGGLALAALAVPYPLLVILGVRAGPGAVAIASLLLSLVAVMAARAGTGPFVAIEPEPVYQGLLLQAYLALVVVPSLLLAFLSREASEAAAQLREVLDHSSEAISVVDVVDADTFRYVRTNARAELLTGYQAPQVVGRTPHELLPARVADRVVAHYRKACATRAPFVVEEALTIGGVTRTWYSTVVPMCDADAVVVRVATFARDVTEERQHEIARAALESQLRQAQKMDAIGRLAGGLAHDFNNILTAVIGHAELLAAALPARTEERESVDAILEAGRRASLLVAQVLTFARRREQARAPVALASVLDEVMRLARATVPSTIDVRVSLESGCPHVLADPTQIHQAVMNLVSNAAYAMRERGGILTIGVDTCVVDQEFTRAHATLKAGLAVCLTVSDTGEGMDRETLEHIYEPFFTTKPMGEGTGLGIPVVLGIVQHHDGGLTIESVRGAGTTVRIYLPAVSEPTSESRRVTTSTPAGMGQRVLLVDDEPAVADIGARLLESLGYAVMQYTDPDEAAIQFLSAPESVDVLVTDLTMPGMTGTQLAERLRRRRPSLPVVIATGVTAAVTVGQDVGVIVLAKPYTRHTLGTAVADLLVGRPVE